MITGYNGFIAKHMIDALNEHDVDLHEWGRPKHSIRGYDWLIHMGAISSTVETDVEKIMRQNVDSSINWLKECIKYDVDMQFSSSASVYGLGKEFKETSPPDPRSPYAWSKYLFEREVLERSPTNIRVQMFRYFNVYGSGEDHKGSQASPYHQFRKQALETGTIKIFEGSNEAIRDFVPVEKVVNIHQQFFNVPDSGLFNVGMGISKSFLDVAEEIAQETGANIKTIPMPEHIKKNYQWFTCADMNKTDKILANNA